MANFARFIMRHRWPVIGVWIVLILFGGFATGKVADRFATDFSIPGHAGYEADQRLLSKYGNGRVTPYVLQYTVKSGDITKTPGIEESIRAVAKADPKSRASSYFDTGEDYYLSKDRRTMYAFVYPSGVPGFGTLESLPPTERAFAASKPDGVEANLTGLQNIILSQGGDTGPGVLSEVLIGAAGALVVLLLIFGTLPAVLIPLMTAIASIFATYAAVWGLTYTTDVSVIVQFLIGVVGLGVAIDYSLLMIFRYREELAKGGDANEALVETFVHSGRAIIVSGSTVAIGLVSMVILPLPFIRSIGIGGMLIPLISVIATLTLQVAVLSLLGRRINRLRIPLFSRLAGLDGDIERGGWARWARFVRRRPLAIFLVGAIVVGVIVSPSFSLHPRNASTDHEPASGQADRGRNALVKAGVTPGVWEPLQVVVEHGASQGDVDAIAAAIRKEKGVVGASAPQDWNHGGTRVVEVLTDSDANLDGATKAIDRIRDHAIPSVRDKIGSGVKVTVAGQPVEDRDFVDAVYGNFPLVLLFVVVLSFLLLTRALRSIVLPLKAVLLNLVSLGAAIGTIVWVFQKGHGSHAIWGYSATDAIIAWIPLMIFAFLYGLSMDYEVFMLSRIREEYDLSHDTDQAVSKGLQHTGKLVTSAAVILMFTFITLSFSPGPDIKQFAIGLAAGIIIDATLIRALLVPTIIHLLGRWNWYLPKWVAKVLFIREPAAPAKG